MTRRLRWIKCTSQPDDGLWLPAPGYEDVWAVHLGTAPPATWSTVGTRPHKPTTFGAGSYATSTSAAGYYRGPNIDGGSLAWPGITVVAVMAPDYTFPVNYNQILAAIVPTGDYYGICMLSVYGNTTPFTYRTVFFRAGDNTSYLTLNNYNTIPSFSDSWVDPGDVVIIVARWDKSTISLAERRLGPYGGPIYEYRNSHAHSYGWRSGTHLSFMGGWDSAEYNIQPMPLVAIFPRDIGPTGEAELLVNPWAMFMRPAFVNVAAAALPTLTAAILPAGVGSLGLGQTKAILPAGVGAMG